MINEIKQTGLILILTLLVNFVFSVPVYAKDDIERAGNIIVLILPIAAGGMALYKDDQEGIVQLSKSLITTLGITAALKYTINTKRPNGGSHSFPSGHASVAFSGASFLQKRYGWKYGIPAYTAASFVGWSRIESNNHYIKDVLAGAAIGTISTYIFTVAYKKEIVVSPFMDEGTFGLRLGATF